MKPEVKWAVIGVIVTGIGIAIATFFSILQTNMVLPNEKSGGNQETFDGLIADGTNQFESEKYLEASYSFDRARQLNPLSDFAWAMEGRSLQELAATKYELGQDKEAGQLEIQANTFFEHALSINPNNVKALFGKGYILLGSQNYAEAIDNFELGIKNIKNGTRDWGLLKGLSRAYSEWGMQTTPHNMTRCDRGLENAQILLNEDKEPEDKPYIYEAMYLAQKCKDNNQEEQKWFDLMQGASKQS